jgi:hypothetical protein
MSAAFSVPGAGRACHDGVENALTETGAGKVVIMVRMTVEESGEAILVYTMRSVSDAAEMMLFLRDFLPGARFVLEPVRH